MQNFKLKKVSRWLAVCALAAMPALAFSQTYTFEQAVQAALQNNPQMEVSSARIQQAQAALSKAQASNMPQINLSMTGSYSNNPLNVFGMKLQQGEATFADFGFAQFDQTNPNILNVAPNDLNSPDARSDINTRIEMLIPIWNGGKIQSFEEQASAMIKAAQQGDKATQQFLTFNIYQSYEAVHAARAFIKVAEQAKKTADEFVRTTQNLMEQGVVVKSELLSAKVNQSEAEVAMMQAQTQEQIALDALRVLMNVAPDEPIDVSERLNLSFNVASMNEALNIAVSQNPMLEAKRREANSAAFAVNAVRADEKPSFNMMVRQDFNDEGLGFGASSYTIAGVAAWKVTDFGVTKSSIDMANASAAEKRASVRSEESKTRLEVLNAWRKLEVAKKQVDANKLAVEQAEEAQELIVKRYENGVSTFTEVLASQTRLDKARANLVSAEFEVNLQKARLRLSLGSMDIAQI